jgi:hypothetical protein
VVVISPREFEPEEVTEECLVAVAEAVIGVHDPELSRQIPAFGDRCTEEIRQLWRQRGRYMQRLPAADAQRRLVGVGDPHSTPLRDACGHGVERIHRPSDRQSRAIGAEWQVSRQRDERVRGDFVGAERAEMTAVDREERVVGRRLQEAARPGRDPQKLLRRCAFHESRHAPLFELHRDRIE